MNDPILLDIQMYHHNFHESDCVQQKIISSFV